MLEAVKKYVRISSEALDEDIQSLITACTQELTANKVDTENENFSELIKLAVKHFVKAHLPGEDLEKHSKCYESLKSYLMTACRKDDSGE